MAKAGLTARYRPQNFAQVAGQDFIKTILSRAAALDRPAHAYLFSGTRGVGKTTVARILAKAINCRKGPAPEPCNECSSCEQITRGSSPDVREIDGASHTGVDHVRKLREEVVYTPMSGRYKVIIIDEAHMLSQSAFNALLKTLEEPPRHCVFIMATTAQEKFPSTVLSRCQHYVFKRLTMKELGDHLKYVLGEENVAYQDEAVQLLARRGDGSVRDSMSMLGQVLALGGEGLKTRDVRQVLGLAEQEVFHRLMQYVLDRNLPGLYELVQYLLNQGLDLGFFLQELAHCWRNLFLLSSGGDGVEKILDMDPQEIDYWRKMAENIPAAHIHAGWQMVLEERKGILSSSEPGLSLELMLYNLAYLPELIPVSDYDPGLIRNPKPSADDFPKESSFLQEQQIQDQKQKEALQPDQAEESRPGPESESSPDPSWAKDKAENSVSEVQKWDDFIKFCSSRASDDRTISRMLGHCRARIEQDSLILIPEKEFVLPQIERNGRKGRIAMLADNYFGRKMQVRFHGSDQRQGADSALEHKVRSHPGVQKIIRDFDAQIMEITRKNINPKT